MKATVMHRAEPATCFSCGVGIDAGAVRAELDGLTLCMQCGALDDRIRDGCHLCHQAIDDQFMTVWISDDGVAVEVPAHHECVGRWCNRLAFTEVQRWPGW